MIKGLKFGEKGVEKKFIHVRINVCGSPLECPGTLLFFFLVNFICCLVGWFLLFLLLMFMDGIIDYFVMVMGFVETFPSVGRVRVKHRGILLTLKGTVIRSGAIKMYEGERMYQCRKCKHV